MPRRNNSRRIKRGYYAIQYTSDDGMNYLIGDEPTRKLMLEYIFRNRDKLPTGEGKVVWVRA